MGNALSFNSFQTVNLETSIENIEELKFLSKLKISRFLKTFIAISSKDRSKQQKMVAKIFIKNNPDDKEINQFLPLFLKENKLSPAPPSVALFIHVYIKEMLLIGIRPYFQYNLYDRLSTRPFLMETEKLWIVYQILRCLEIVHSFTAHGDLKLENILMTSWGFVVLTDFFFNLKPTFIPRKTAIETFNYFFDASGRQTCNIAPERFVLVSYYESLKSKTENFLTPEMDIFSLGCLIFQLYTDGKRIFKLNDIISYINGELSYESIIHNIKKYKLDQSISELICKLISLHPENRPNISECLKSLTFPSYFSPLYNVSLFIAQSDASPNFIIFYIKKSLTYLLSIIDISDDKQDAETGILHLADMSCFFSLQITLKKSKYAFFEIILKISKYLSSELILNRILPYLLRFIDDPLCEIRSSIPLKLLKLIQNITIIKDINEINVFSAYIFPKFLILVNDPSPMVRLCVIHVFPNLCYEALKFHISIAVQNLTLCQKSIDLELESLCLSVREINKTYLIESSPQILSEYLHKSFPRIIDFLNLIQPFDQTYQDEILSLLVSVLNSKDWIIRKAFYDILPLICKYFRREKIQDIYFLFSQGLYDNNEFVVSSILICLISLIKRNFFNDETIINLLKSVSPFLIHPNPLINQTCKSFVKTLCHLLPFLEQQSKMFPILLPYFKPNSPLKLGKFFNERNLYGSYLNPISYAALEIILTSSASDRFFKILKKKQHMIETLTNDIDFEEFFGVQDDSIQSILNHLRSIGFQSPLYLTSVLLLKNHFKIYQNKISVSSEQYINNQDMIKFSISKEIQMSDIDKILSKYQITNSKLLNKTTENDKQDISVINFENRIDNMYFDFHLKVNKILKNHLNKINEVEKFLNYTNSTDLKESKESLNKNNEISISYYESIPAHFNCITKIAKFSSFPAFATASDDCSVKIWNISNIDQTDPRFSLQPFYVYSEMLGPVKSIAALDDTLNDKVSRIACSSPESSEVRIFNFSVESANSTSKIPYINCYIDCKQNGVVVDLSVCQKYSSPILIAGTLYTSLLMFDLRLSPLNPVLRLSLDSDDYLTTIESDPFNCFNLMGTSLGTIHLWDNRFYSKPVNSFLTQKNKPISRIKHNVKDFSQIICCFKNSLKPICIYNLETGLQESSFSIDSNKPTICTSVENCSKFDDHSIFFGCTDCCLRLWNVKYPEKSSLMIPSFHPHSKIGYATYSNRVASSESSMEVQENIINDPIFSAQTISNFKGATKSYSSDLLYLEDHNFLVMGLSNGSLNVYKSYFI